MAKKKTENAIPAVEEFTEGAIEGVTEGAIEESLEDPTQPVALELKVGDSQPLTPKPIDREEITTAVKEKLSKKTDEKKSDPFVPQAQLDNEVVQVAREQGFHLSRGTEIGARLLARARRREP